MNDRELLELAAKAAGILLVWDGDSPKEVTEHWSCDQTEPPHEREWDWNPVSDDGDALRLAVKLHITIQFPWDSKCRFIGETRCWTDSDDQVIELNCEDPYAATRRAIVRAAAEIGRKMQKGGAA